MLNQKEDEVKEDEDYKIYKHQAAEQKKPSLFCLIALIKYRDFREDGLPALSGLQSYQQLKNEGSARP